MLSDSVLTRSCTIEDVAEIAFLITELGYPSTIEDVKIRLDRIFSHSDYKTIAATVDNKIVAIAGLWKGIFYEKNDYYARIVAFVVRRDYRNQGVGKRLIEDCESWAFENNLKTIFINCGNREERINARKFYKKVGYEVKSYGFVKNLN